MSLQPSPRGGHHHHHHHHHHHAHATSPTHGQPPPLIHRPLQYDAQPVQQRRLHHHHHHHRHSHAHAHRHHHHGTRPAAPAYDFVPSSRSGSGSAGSSSSSGSSSSARSPPNHINIPALPAQAPSSAIPVPGKRERSISLSSLGSGSDSDDEDEDDAQSFDVNELGQETYEDPARGRDRISIAALAGPASQRNEQAYHHSSRPGPSSLPTQKPASGRAPGSSNTTASQPPTQQPRDRPPKIADLFANAATTSRQSFDSLFWERQLWLMEHRGADGLSHCSGSEDEAEHHDDSDVDEHDDEQEDEDEGVSPPVAVKRSSKRRRRQGNAAASSDVLRTHGAGLPLARVKRVMKGSDPAIKMISHESPSLVSRLCTVFITELTSRAARHAMTQSESGGTRRTTIMPEDLRAVTIGTPEQHGSSSEWEFLDVLIHPWRVWRDTKGLPECTTVQGFTTVELVQLLCAARESSDARLLHELGDDAGQGASRGMVAAFFA